MLVQLPRLTNSLREPFDIDQAYLQRKIILETQKKSINSGNSLDESELARKIVHRWEEASVEVRQVYKQFIGAVVELIDGDVPSEEFREVVLTAYRLFSGSVEVDEVDKNINEKTVELQKVIGHGVSHANVRKVSSLAQKLSQSQPRDSGAILGSEKHVDGSGDDSEFGADLAFKAPARFLVDVSLEDVELLGEESIAPSSSFIEGWHDKNGPRNYHGNTDSRNFNLSWLRDSCELIVRGSTSQLSRDDLAMAICRVLDSDKPGEEIAGDLLDLVGDSAFETVQDLLSHRKELVEAIHHGLSVLKSEKLTSSSQSRMPSYGTQVTVQTESEKQIDKLRRKEEKRNRRATEYGAENDMSAASFSSLLQASEKRSPFEDLSGSGQGSNSVAVTALPQGTVGKHFKGRGGEGRRGRGR